MSCKLLPKADGGEIIWLRAHIYVLYCRPLLSLENEWVDNCFAFQGFWGENGLYLKGKISAYH